MSCIHCTKNQETRFQLIVSVLCLKIPSCGSGRITPSVRSMGSQHTNTCICSAPIITFSSLCCFYNEPMIFSIHVLTVFHVFQHNHCFIFVTQLKVKQTHPAALLSAVYPSECFIPLKSFLLCICEINCVSLFIKTL